MKTATVVWGVRLMGIALAGAVLFFGCSPKNTSPGNDLDGNIDDSGGDGHSDTDSDTDSDADSDADSSADKDADSDADSDTDSDTDGDTDTDADADSDSDADSDADLDADSDADTDTDTTGDTDSDGDTDADSDRDTDANSDNGTDADADADTDDEKDSDTGESAVAGIIYVAPEGDDANPGTLEQPLKTLERARDRVRTINSAMTDDITVYLRAGTYPLTSTLSFSNDDSGRDGFHVKYMAYEDERPLITGGQPITGWEVFDAANDIYSANAGTTAFRQLYVNGAKAVRARTPNLLENNVPDFNRLSGWDKDAHNVQVPSSAVGEWNNLTKVEMHIMIAWGDSTLRIASISNSGGTAYVMFQPDEDAIVFMRPNPRMDQVGWGEGRAYYFENALEFLDQPGEWYLDETTSTVYYKPRDGEDITTATVIAPMVQTLMIVEGTSTSDPAGYLWFEGLTFAHSTFMRPSEHGFLDAQAGQYNLTAEANNDQTVGRPPAGVSVMNANHLHFERNLFTQMGATGLDFISGTRDDMIIGNVFTEIAGNGFSIGKFTASETTEYHIPYNPTDENEICTRDTFKNNYINRVTTEFQGGCGIAAGYPAYLTIEHNEVSHTSYTGISVGYGWTDQPNAMTHNKINYNNIHHVNEIMTDGGAIYTLSNQDNSSEIQYNYIHDYSCSQWADYGCNGLYLDEQTSGYTVAHNALIDCPTNVAQNQTGNNTIMDNGGNPSGAEETIATAGIEPSYADIKNLIIPPAEF